MSGKHDKWGGVAISSVLFFGESWYGLAMWQMCKMILDVTRSNGLTIRDGMVWNALMALGLCGCMSPGWCATFSVVNTNAAGTGSLRQAILDANNTAGTDTIAFAITGSGPFTITPTNALPQIIEPVILDGTTQSGYTNTPRIEIAGHKAGSSANGLLLLAGYSTVRGLAINRFSSSGIQIEGYGSNVIQANFVGLDVTGTMARSNAQAGINIYGSPNNQIGGLGSGQGNVVSGNMNNGIVINGPNARGNRIEGNWIGVNRTGTLGVGNTNNGVLVYNASENWIRGNVISGNSQSGVYLMNSGSTRNSIQGNRIGTDSAGTNRVANRSDGITCTDAPGNWIGGVNTGEGNVISGNAGCGVLLTGSGSRSNTVVGNNIGTDRAGLRAISNSKSGVGIQGCIRNKVGSSTGGNLISGNAQSGVSLYNELTRLNWIQGNKIGTDATGLVALTNGLDGVTIYGPSNSVGGVSAGMGNVISGNWQNGICIIGTNAIGNRVQGNTIGLGSDGAAALGNGLAGVMLDNSSANEIGGTVPEARNFVSWNKRCGVYLAGMNARSNVVSGNYIGTDVSGTVAAGNDHGIGITNGSCNLIGGYIPADRNLISGNTNMGIYVLGSGAVSNVLAGNYIGTDVWGRTELANRQHGIYLSAPRTIVGGAEPGAGNLVSGNRNVGISVGDPVTVGTVIQGNWIGMQADGLSPLGNLWHNIEVMNQASQTTIGGIEPRAGNRIAFAQTALYAGVRIRDGCTGNCIRGNQIFSNAALGIDLGTNGVTLNDAGDPDTGANMLQNFPVLVSASGRYKTTITGTLNSLPNRSFALDFYCNAQKDSSGYGEGQIHVGSRTVQTSAAGNASFTAVFTNVIPTTGFLSATATDTNGNTSEFAQSIAITVDPVADSDRDGMPNDYETGWGFNPMDPSDAGKDADGDGFTNLQEYQAQTNPLDADDGLRFEMVARMPPDIWLAFGSRSGKKYAIVRENEFSGAWVTVVTNLAGCDGNLWACDTNAMVRSMGYYRLICVP